MGAITLGRSTRNRVKNREGYRKNFDAINWKSKQKAEKPNTVKEVDSCLKSP